MKYFLNQERRSALYNVLVECGVSVEAAKVFTEVEDNLAEVDTHMYAHVKSIVVFRNKGDMEEAAKGIACLASLMAEAKERGLMENDFPESLAAIRDDLTEHYSETRH